MALVLKAVENKKGVLTRFDVVRAEEGSVSEVLHGIDEGDYKVLDGSSVVDATTQYRTVQDVVVNGRVTTIEH